MNIETALRGLKDAESKLSQKYAVANPALISEEMYRLGQFASALEQFLGDAEEEYETNWAKCYHAYTTTSTYDGKVMSKALSATAAKQKADVDMAVAKGNIKKLQRYVSAAWHVHMSCMARHKHLSNEMKGSM